MNPVVIVVLDAEIIAASAGSGVTVHPQGGNDYLRTPAGSPLVLGGNTVVAVNDTFTVHINRPTNGKLDAVVYVNDPFTKVTLNGSTYYSPVTVNEGGVDKYKITIPNVTLTAEKDGYTKLTLTTWAEDMGGYVLTKQFDLVYTYANSNGELDLVEGHEPVSGAIYSSNKVMKTKRRSLTTTGSPCLWASTRWSSTPRRRSSPPRCTPA